MQRPQWLQGGSSMAEFPSFTWHHMIGQAFST